MPPKSQPYLSLFLKWLLRNTLIFARLYSHRQLSLSQTQQHKYDSCEWGKLTFFFH